MEEIKILFDSVLYAVYISPVIFFLSFVAYIVFMKYKKQSSKISIESNNSTESDVDIFGLNLLKDEKKFKEELEEIRRSINSGDQQIKVEFTKAMYILKHFDDYNFFSSEDNKIIFEKLKTIIDNETQIENVMVDSNMSEKISISEKPFNQTTEILEDGSIKVYNPNGYTIIKDRLIVKTYNYEVEEKKKADENKKSGGNNSKVEELEEKIHSMEDQLLNNDDKKPKSKKQKNVHNKKVVIEPVIDAFVEENKKNFDSDENELKNDVGFDSKTMNDDINKLLENFSINDTNEISENITSLEVNLNDKKSIEKIQNIPEEKQITKLADVNFRNTFLKDLKSKNELLQDSNMVFILENFDKKFKDRIYELLDWLFDCNSLLDKENKLVFCDFDLENKTLYVDAYLFVYLLSKFYDNMEKFNKVFLYSGEILNSENLKKILDKLNYILSEKYDKEFFKFIGKSSSPFTERVVTYEIDGIKRILSTQMLMINMCIEEEDFEAYVENAKEVIVSIDVRPKVYKVTMKNKKEIDSFGFDYFKKISVC